MKLLRIEAPHFVAGLVLERKRVVDGAPILRYMRNWSYSQVRNYCAKKGWSWEEVDEMW